MDRWLTNGKELEGRVSPSVVLGTSWITITKSEGELKESPGCQHLNFSKYSKEHLCSRSVRLAVARGVCSVGVWPCSAAQVFLTLCYRPMDCSPPGSSNRGISQARMLEWVAISFSRGSSWPIDQTHVSFISCIGRWILYHWATWEAPVWVCFIPFTTFCGGK